MLKTHVLKAVPGTAMSHRLHESLGPDVAHPRLTPSLTKPVFQAPPGLSIDEPVAVAFRDGDRKPVHGGLYGITPDGVVKLVLVDEARGVDTDANPAWTAFGLNMSLGKLLVRTEAGTVDVPWSIVDFGMHEKDADLRNPTEGRLAVRDAYIEEILPTLGFDLPGASGPGM